MKATAWEHRRKKDDAMAYVGLWRSADGACTITNTGNPIPCPPKANLCSSAHQDCNEKGFLWFRAHAKMPAALKMRNLYRQDGKLMPGGLSFKPSLSRLGDQLMPGKDQAGPRP